jgi:hypothetical protein
VAEVTAWHRHEWSAEGVWWLEVEMPVSQKEMRGGKAFAFPLIGIISLLVCYWVLAEWHDMPALLNAALTSVKW